jgi:hypothetical protein
MRSIATRVIVGGIAAALVSMVPAALGGASLAAGAVAPSCTTVSIATLDAKLGIAAAHVHATHPGAPAGSLICSYYGNSGLTENEATLTFVPATAAAFASVKAALSNGHSIRTITGIKQGAYSYLVASQRYLYVLDGSEQVQLYATVALARLEQLARALPALS